MNAVQAILTAATLLAAAGFWLLLPRGDARGRALGAVFALASFCLFASQLPLVERWIGQSVFLILAATTILSAVGAVTMRSPVYCAIWFAMTLLGTAGLFLYQGAQFLGVATIVVYAGAILVTFLFVLMLAQAEGFAYYDRVSWEGFLSACAGAAMIGVLTTVIGNAFASDTSNATAAASMSARSARHVHPLADPATAQERAEEILSEYHMDHLGAQLFSRHLIAVEVAGTMLLAALVGAVAIAIQGKQPTRSAGGARHG